MSGLDRRALLRGGLLGGAGAVALAAGVAAAAPAGSQPSASPTAGRPRSARPWEPPGNLVVPFHGEHQPGIMTPPQPHAVFVGLDLVDGAGREELARLMRVWSDDIARLMDGRGPLTDQEPELSARTAGLTVTVGWGSSLFVRAGIEDLRPHWLRPVPAMPIDDLDPAYGECDIVLVIAAHSPVTVSHARRHLVNAAAGIARGRWLQAGFREPMEYHGWSMRNAFGQVDGTEQPDVEGVDADLLWVGPGDGWAGGSSLVLRRVAMDLADWDRADRPAREHSIGRDLATGAPLTGGDVDAPVDLHARHANGLPVVDRHAHVRRAAPQAPHERFLRRPYTYEEVGRDGSVHTGLLFAAYQADPMRQFVPVQRRLAEADLLNLWTTPVGSAVFALLPGCREGGWLGEHLLT